MEENAMRLCACLAALVFVPGLVLGQDDGVFKNLTAEAFEKFGFERGLEVLAGITQEAKSLGEIHAF